MNMSSVKKQVRKIQWLMIKIFGLLIHYFSRIPDRNIGESCYVLGRGKSLEEFTKSDGLNVECFLANFDDETIDAIGVQHLLDKNLTIVSNYVEPILIKYLWYRLKIRNVYSVMFKENPGIWRGRRRGYGRLEIYGVNVLLLPPDLGPEFTAKLRNTGLIAIHLAASIHKKIFLYGFDFYGSEYVCGPLTDYGLTEKAAQEHRDIAPDLIKNFYKIVDYWPDVEFEISTYAVLKDRRPNLIIHNHK
jgi:hypothetical protein